MLMRLGFDTEVAYDAIRAIDAAGPVRNSLRAR
jgi:hypothetical protein